MADIDKAVELARIILAEVYDGAYVGAVGDGPVLARAVLAMAPTFAAAQVQAEKRREYDAAEHEDHVTDRTWNAWLDACDATTATLDAEARRG